MNKFSKKRVRSLIYTVIAVAFLCQNAYAKISNECLSVPSFGRPLTQDEDFANSIEVFVVHSLIEMKDDAVDLSKLTIDEFKSKAIRAERRRLDPRNLTRIGDNEYKLTITVNGQWFEAFITISDNNIKVKAEKTSPPLGTQYPRMFPVKPKAIEIPAETEQLMTVIEDMDFSYVDNSNDFLEPLIRAFIIYFNKGFYDDHIFGQIKGVGALMEGEDDMSIEVLPVNWIVKYENYSLLRDMIFACASHYPDSRADLARLSFVAGKMYYKTRTQGGYSKSEFFFSIAHQLENDNVNYHKNWAWALFHCRAIDEAKSEIEKLIKNHPERKKLFTDMAYITIYEAEQELKALEKRTFSSLPYSDFMESESSISSSVKLVRNLSNIEKGPRAASGIGESYVIEARLNFYAYNFLSGITGKEEEARQKLIQTIFRVDNALKFLHRGYQEEKRKGGGEHHAENMMIDFSGMLLEVMRGVWKEIQEKGYAFPEKKAHMIRNLKQIALIERENDAVPASISTDYAAVGSLIVEWLELQGTIVQFFKEEIKTVNEDQVEAPGAFIDSIKTKVLERIKAYCASGSVTFTVADTKLRFLVDSMVDYSVNKIGIDKLELAVINVRYRLADEDEDMTLGELGEYIKDLFGMELPEEKQFIKKINELSSFLGFDLKEEQGDEEDNDDLDDEDEDNREENVTDLVDRKVLRDSIKDNNGSNIMSKVLELKAQYNALLSWEDDFKNDYISQLGGRINTLYDGLKEYVEKVEFYLRINRPNDEKPTSGELRSAGLAASSKYSRTKSESKELKKLIEKRINRVKDMVYPDIQKAKVRLSVNKSRYEKFDIPWLSNQLTLASDLLGNLTDIFENKKSPNYLSRDETDSLLMELNSISDNIDKFGKRIDSFKDIITMIDKAALEVHLSESYWGRAPVFDEYIYRLGEAKKYIIRKVVNGYTADSLTSDEKAFYQGIDVRTQLLVDLRKTIRISTEGFAENYGKGIVNLIKDKDLNKRCWRAAFDVVRDDIFSKTDKQHNILRMICNLSIPTPDSETVVFKAREIGLKAILLFHLNQLTADETLEYLKFCYNRINQCAPGTLDNHIIKELSAKRENLLILRFRFEGLDVDSEGFDAEAAEIMAQCMTDGDALVDIKKRMFRLYLRRVGEEIKIVKDMVVLWGREWGSPILDAETVEEVDRSFSQFAGSLFEESETLEHSERFSDGLRDMKIIWADIYKRFRLKNNRTLEMIFDHFCKSEMMKIADRNMKFAKQASQRNNTVGLAQPHRSADGKIDGFLCGVVTKSKDPSIVTRVYTGQGSFDYKSRGLGINLENTISKYNACFNTDDPEFAGIEMDPELFTDFVTFIFARFRILVMAGLKEEPDNIHPVDIISQLKGGIIDSIYESNEKVLAELKNNGDFVTVLNAINKKIKAIDDKRGKHAISEKQEAEYLRYSNLKKMFIANHILSWYDLDRANAFFSNFIAMFNKVSGRNYDIPDALVTDKAHRLSFTLNEKNIPKLGLSIYPPSEVYKDVYLDSREARFQINARPAEVCTDKTLDLATLLNMSLNFYLKKVQLWDMSDPHLENPYNILEKILSAVRKKGDINISVSKDLPTNSLVAGTTIFFDQDFIEFLMKRGGEFPDAALMIMAERLIHELGHISLMDETVPDTKERLISEEIEQITRDVLFYDNLVLSAPRLSEEIDRFTDLLIEDGPDKGRKFSHVFHSGALFKKIHKWARMHRSEPEKVKKEITIFVSETLDSVGISPSPYVQFFPNFSSDNDTGQPDELARERSARIPMSALREIFTDINMTEDKTKRKIDFITFIDVLKGALAASANTPRDLVEIYEWMDVAYQSAGDYNSANVYDERIKTIRKVTSGRALNAVLDSEDLFLEVIGRLRAKRLLKGEITQRYIAERFTGKNSTVMLQWLAETLYPEPDDKISLKYLFMSKSAEKLGLLEDRIMNDLSGKSDEFLRKTRKIVISSGLIPECQKGLIGIINEQSKQAYESGRSKDIIEIRNLSFINNMRSSEDTDIVVMLEADEVSRYRGNEARLAFERTGDHPVILNGIIAAGRAVLYEQIDILRDILVELSASKNIVLPQAIEMERMLRENKLRELPVIKLPHIIPMSSDTEELNRNILRLIKYA